MAADPHLRFELTGVPDEKHYLIHSRLEIAAILGGVMAARSRVTAYCDPGGGSLLTVLTEVNHNTGRLLLDCSRNRQINGQVLGAGRLVCVTSLNRVRIQFAGRAAGLTRHQGRDAFLLPWPRQLLRLQRREYYRLMTPVADPLECIISPDGEPLLQQGTALQIADISAGGFSAHCSDALPGIQPGARHQVLITLPAGDVLRVAAELRNTFEFTLPGGQVLRRYGWKFPDLQQRELMLIERYVIEQQRLLRSGRRRPP